MFESLSGLIPKGQFRAEIGLNYIMHKNSVFKGYPQNHSYQISFFWEKEKPPKFSFTEFGYTDLHLWRQIFNANALKFNSNGMFCSYYKLDVAQ